MLRLPKVVNSSHTKQQQKHASGAFSLIELLITMAVIGVMGALIIAAITNASRDSSSVIARQQQVVLQEALNAWISANASGTNTVSSARTRYANASDKLALVRDYLQASTYDHFVENTTNSGRVQSSAMKKANVYVRFSEWNATNYPSVEMFQ